MIVVSLFLYRRNIKNAMNAPVKVGGLYKAIATSLTESCALYSVTFLLFIGPWAANSPIAGIFNPMLAGIQVRAIFHFPHAPLSRDVVI